jgi:hypothetical protein
MMTTNVQLILAILLSDVSLLLFLLMMVMPVPKTTAIKILEYIINHKTAMMVTLVLMIIAIMLLDVTGYLMSVMTEMLVLMIAATA